jgi:hypothetical protein
MIGTNSLDRMETMIAVSVDKKNISYLLEIAT